MAQTVCILPSAEDRARLAAVIGDRNSPQKHVQRAKIILHSAEKRSVLDVARQSGVSRPAVWRWQRRYAEQGGDGLLRDSTRKPGKCATMTHDYKRNGTTTLFAALNVLDGTVLGRCMKRHRHQEFIKFLNAVERKVAAGKIIHVILDNYGTPTNIPRWTSGWPITPDGSSTLRPHPRPG